MEITWGFDVKQARRMVQDRSGWQEFVFVFYHGLTSICDPMVDTCSYHKRGVICNLQEETFISDIRQTAP